MQKPFFINNQSNSLALKCYFSYPFRSIISSKLFFALMLCFCVVNVIAQGKPIKPVPPLVIEKGGRIAYTKDSLGNRIPDFSYCGYKSSEQPIPMVDIKITVPQKSGDATARIQAAIDYLASLPLNKDGFRGAVLLEKGKYEIQGQIQINAAGIVLRGSGAGVGGTELIGVGTTRADFIKIGGTGNKLVSAETKITDGYVPVNATAFTISNDLPVKLGDKIIIHRPSTKEWIETIGTEIFGGGISTLGWKPGERDLFFDRTITAINGNIITIDAPLTTAIDAKYGGGYIATYQWNGRIENVGVENLHCISSFDANNLKDEAHRWDAINIENTTDAWVRQIRFDHFAGSAVNLLASTNKITVEDCASYSPVSEIGGQRRYTFLTNGQQTLFQRCFAENGYHDFATGYCAPGPNAFVQCESYQPHNFSGAIDSWSSGILFDIVNIDGNALRFGNRGQDGQGAGWAAANSLFWNCSAARIDCYKPPTAQNWSFGSWAQFAGDGYWTASNDALNPRSLFYAQLKERIKKDVENQSQILFVPTEASSSPSVAVAAALTAQSLQPRTQLFEWIAAAGLRNPITINSKNIISIDAIGIKKIISPALAPAMVISKGWIVRGNTILTGIRKEVPWWNGGIQGKDLITAQPAITRFVPGRIGQGLTDDLNELTNNMLAKHIVGMEQHYALWYDRRRDDHERIRRMDGEVWAPFYELPFARTGKELGWDGLSKYDLTKYNTWYWSRLKEFANLVDQKGLLLVHQNYFQHNIIEAGAHYADFPWRSANNINQTGFPEPPPYAGDKRIFMGEQFYDISNPIRKELHKKYIRQCLENFKDNNGVIQLIGEEFTGPLHFVKFWLDVIKDWEKESGKKQLIGLSVTKDVQDSILENPNYASLVNIIDIRYWHIQADGTIYAPQGGQNLAPRQHARLLKPKKTSFDQVFESVKTYRLKYPNKAVIYSSDSFDQFGWAVFMAGGSLPVLPSLPNEFLTAASNMKPITIANNKYALSDGTNYIIYHQGSNLQLSLADKKANYLLQWIDPKSGRIIGQEQKLNATAFENLQRSATAEVIAWVTKLKD